MPLTPSQCTGELATKAVVEYIDRALDSSFCNLSHNPNPDPTFRRTITIQINISGIIYTEEFAELITQIYTDCGWDVQSYLNGGWAMQFRTRIGT